MILSGLGFVRYSSKETVQSNVRVICVGYLYLGACMGEESFDYSNCYHCSFPPSIAILLPFSMLSRFIQPSLCFL